MEKIAWFAKKTFIVLLILVNNLYGMGYAQVPESPAIVVAERSESRMSISGSDGSEMTHRTVTPHSFTHSPNMEEARRTPGSRNSSIMTPKTPMSGFMAIDFSIHDLIENKKVEKSDIQNIDQELEDMVEGIRETHKTFVYGTLNLSHEVSQGQLKSIDGIDRIDFIQRIHTLNLTGNQLTEIPDVAALVNLKELEIGRNKIKSLPQEVKYLQQLETLILNDNELENLPTELIGYTKLTRLNVKKNMHKLTEEQQKIFLQSARDLAKNMKIKVFVEDDKK